MTAEFATVLPVVALIAVILLGLTRTVVVSMNCQDAAAAAARELVVARDEANPQATARAIAGDAAVVSVNRHDSTVQVQVTCPVLPDPLGVLPTTVTGSATGVWG
ncbi:TadE family type IV pilus minor pilin [Bifidobacterium goeldii]|uniref:TadE family type IV pilus minor pilin n=1 Tax=Bifidobacterium goeldii TaxID=2306975 RepID=UPI0019D0E386|nr:TadE family type IV pilus minor pilin [Bifidobacterium goeldii]